MNKQNILFDLDDTLIHCNRHFVSAREQFLGYMEQLFRPYAIHIHDVDSTQQQIDLAGIQRQGLGKSRFPQSLIETYLLFCEKYGKSPQAYEMKRIEKIGYSVYEQAIELLPDALSVLQSLVQLGHELYLYTGGDFQIQTRKIVEAGLGIHFEERRRYISEHKNLNVLRKILSSHQWNPRTVWMVGNSARSDIRPALEAGIHAIHIPDKGGWAFDQVDLEDVKSGTLFVAESIKEVPEIIERHLGECEKSCVG